MKDTYKLRPFIQRRAQSRGFVRFLTVVLALICCQTVLSDSNQTITFTYDTTACQLFCPYLGKVISPFGSRGGRKHTGADIKLQKGDSVGAAMNGVVKMAKSYYGYGKLVILTHPDGFETYYAHLCKCLVKKGDTVRVGSVVGLGGRTGRATTNHLHFEVRKNGSPLNPEQYFCFAEGIVKKPILMGVQELFVSIEKKPEPPVFTLQNDNTLVIPASEAAFVTIQKGDVD